MQIAFPRALAGALSVAVLALACLALSTAQARAATVTVTGDDGNPAPLTQGVPGAIRNMSPRVGLAFNTAGRFNLSITGPDGVAVATPVNCLTNYAATRYLDYRGNGNYTIAIDNFRSTDTNCRTRTSSESYVFSINAGITLTQPARPFLRRQRNSYITRSLEMPVALNPGASRYELQFARNAAVGPDGAISGPSESAYLSSTTGIASFRFSKPGVYTAVARAGSGPAGFYSPWSAPIRIVVKDPFDLSTVSFPDSRGPVYRLKGTLRSDVIRGPVFIAIAPARRGKFRSLGRARIVRGGVFFKRFRQARPGVYRLRFVYRGSRLGAKGAVVTKIRIRRRLAF